MKTCSACKKEKYFVDFHKDKTKKDGYCNQCKICKINYLNIYYKENREKVNEKNRQYNKKNKEYFKIRYKKNIEYYKQYKQENKEKIREQKREYSKKRRQTDILFKLTHNIRNLIYQSIKNNGYTKRSKTFKILGCNYEEFKLYIERQFKDGMSWENSGQWHYDHIYPVSLAKDEEELIRLNHYTNFQPLWAEDNLRKGNKIQ